MLTLTSKHFVRIAYGMAFNSTRVNRAGKISADRVKQTLNALVLERATAYHRHNRHRKSGGTQSLAYLVLGDSKNPKEEIGCGDIGAGVGFKDIRTGDTLCAEDAPIVLEAMEFPDPVIGIASTGSTRTMMSANLPRPPVCFLNTSRSSTGLVIASL